MSTFLTHHGVLAHENDALASKGLPDRVHLVGADIVNCDDENGLVLLQQGLQLVEVDSFIRGFAPHVFLQLKIGCLRAKLW